MLDNFLIPMKSNRKNLNFEKKKEKKRCVFYYSKMKTWKHLSDLYVLLYDIYVLLSDLYVQKSG
jgi:hypothetical protein